MCKVNTISMSNLEELVSNIVKEIEVCKENGFEGWTGTIREGETYAYNNCLDMIKNMVDKVKSEREEMELDYSEALAKAYIENGDKSIFN